MLLEHFEKNIFIYWNCNIYHDTCIDINVFSLKRFIITSGWFASIFLSVFIVKSHRFVTSVLSVTDCSTCSYHFFVWGRLQFLHNTQCIKLAICSCLWRYFVLTVVRHADNIGSTVCSLFVHSLQLRSAPLSRIFVRHTCVDMLWS